MTKTGLHKMVAPASKSYLQRAIAIAALANGTSVLKNISWCNDSKAAAHIARGLGAVLVEEDNNLHVRSKGLSITSNRFCAGEAGLSIRMFSPVLALANHEIIFTGEGSLLKRPAGFIADALNQLGAGVTTSNGFLPLTIKGGLKPGIVHVDGSISSQLLTGLLMALPLLKGDSTILVDNLKSKPYIDMTLSIMEHFGVNVINEQYQVFRIKGNQQYSAKTYNVEGDWSAASFLLIIGAVKGGIEVRNLKGDSKQADRKIIAALKKAGAEVEQTGNSVIVKQKKLDAFGFDATHSPDLFPPLACLASQCAGTSVIKGVSRLVHKESNRAETIKQEFAKMGIAIRLKDDRMYITGSKALPCTVDSHNDHRIAMAGGVMNLFCDAGTIRVTNPQAINKSYPEFFDVIGDL